MFFPPIRTWFRVGFEQVSPSGSGSPTTESEPAPPSTSSPVPLSVAMTPLLWPEMRFRAPGVEGPKVVPYRLSLMAKCCA